MKDSRYPWIILVPWQENLTELHELEAESYAIVMAEVRRASRLMTDLFSAHKINIGALGNMVSQLHIHVIAGNRTTPPGPGRSGASAQPFPTRTKT